MRITGGEYRGRRLVVPAGNDVRPTSDRTRQAVFNLLTAGRFLGDIDFVLDGAQVIDAFCGTGALGLEALSRDAAGCVFIDRHKPSLNAARQNADNFGLEGNIHFLQADAAKLGPRSTYIPLAHIPLADLVFIDPPYRQGLIKPVLLALSRNGWLAPQALCVVESERQIADDELLPPSFELLDTRPYGDSVVRIVHYHS